MFQEKLSKASEEEEMKRLKSRCHEAIKVIIANLADDSPEPLRLLQDRIDYLKKEDKEAYGEITVLANKVSSCKSSSDFRCLLLTLTDELKGSEKRKELDKAEKAREAQNKSPDSVISTRNFLGKGENSGSEGDGCIFFLDEELKSGFRL